jgi:thiol-disulfide isomerase/thioredoxin
VDLRVTRQRRTVRATVALVAVMVALVLGDRPAVADEPVVVQYFWADGCPYCELEARHLDGLEERFGDDLVVERHEVSGDPTARERWTSELAVRGREASGVPTTIIGDRVWVGFDAGIGDEITHAIEELLTSRAARAPPPRLGPEPPEAVSAPSSVGVPLVGDVDLDGRSAVAATALIAFVDGFNPCSLWVLTVLLAMVLHVGATRRRVAVVGGTFLTVTGLLYGAFIVGVFSVLTFVQHLGAVRLGVAGLALLIGAINVKDYVAFKRGPSLTISDRHKPWIYRAGRSIRDPGRSLPAVIGVTTVMAAGIALIELPCTAGFPVIWTGIMRTQGVEGAAFAALLALYLLIYVVDELVLFVAAVVTLRIGRFQESHGRMLKLVGGTVMLALGGVLIVAPGLMDDLVGVTMVMGGAIGAAAAIVLAGRVRQARRAADAHP